MNNPTLLSTQCGIHYRIYRNENSFSNHRLLCIHGAGVAGQLTYEYICYYLSQYREVLVPDLLGMGDSDSADKSWLDLDDYLQGLLAVLEVEQWQAFNLCGYSLGGLLAAKFNLHYGKRYTVDETLLIEPALFDDIDIEQTRRFRRHYRQIALDIQAGQDADECIVRFLDLVSPKRPKNARSEKMTIRRLGHRVNGFAQALYAVAQAAESIDRDALVLAQKPNVTVLLGQNSYPNMLQCHKEIQLIYPWWRTQIIAGTDHSMPYQKPRRVAEVLDGFIVDE